MATLPALQLIETLRARHGPVLFHQSGGCCDGSSPMCYPVDDFIVGDRDVRLGEIGGAAFYISSSQFEYWKLIFWDSLCMPPRYRRECADWHFSAMPRAMTGVATAVLG